MLHLHGAKAAQAEVRSSRHSAISHRRESLLPLLPLQTQPNHKLPQIQQIIFTLTVGVFCEILIINEYIWRDKGLTETHIIIIIAIQATSIA